MKVQPLALRGRNSFRNMMKELNFTFYSLNVEIKQYHGKGSAAVLNIVTGVKQLVTMIAANVCCNLS